MMYLRMPILIALLSLFLSVSYGQVDTAWKDWSWLVGTWAGEGSGTPGEGSGQFSLMPDLNGKVLVRKNHSEYPAAKDRTLIIHDDLMIVYHENTGLPEQAIYFDNEGHTIRYHVSHTDTSVVFTSEKVQSAPVFRLTYDLLAADSISVKFEMSRDGEKFMTYTEGKCHRVK
ncbi:MAG TPA: hypothetical protein VLY03_13750 [Bacteroidota bacterium]|nr:hypothetical protein [Bacteroidota bacterium]